MACPCQDDPEKTCPCKEEIAALRDALIQERLRSEDTKTRIEDLKRALFVAAREGL